MCHIAVIPKKWALTDDGLPCGRAAPSVERWELSTEAEGQSREGRFHLWGHHGSDRGHADTAVGVEEPKFTA